MLEKADLILAYDRNVRDELIKRLENEEKSNKISTVKGYLTGQEHTRDDWTLDTDDAQKFEGRS